MSPAERILEHATCLGCGCACDDIAVVVRRERIVEARNACGLGVAWFGDGRVPEEVRANERKTSVARALDRAAELLSAAKRPLVYLAGDISCETQREAVAIADHLHALLDGLAATAGAGVLAAQHRGRAGASLGEIRQRADLVVFWGVDPAARYPRYTSRYAVDPQGLQVPDGRRGRTVIAVDIGANRGPADADGRVALAPADELDALGVMRATLERRRGSDDEARFRPAAELAERMSAARYAVIVADAEPGASAQPRQPPQPPEATPLDRAEALVCLAQALNGPTRGALSTLRAGGNRSGADAVLTWQTGYPFAVDYARGYPSYRPHAGAVALLATGEIDAALVVGAPATLPASIAQGLASVGTIVLGPRASAATFHPTVVIDTGVAGIHEGGTAFRMDDVPLPLRPALEGSRTALATVLELGAKLAGRGA
jgi:formylmethanofuran dehydrogenase subunit B